MDSTDPLNRPLLAGGGPDEESVIAVFDLDGLTCSSCVNTVVRGLVDQQHSINDDSNNDKVRVGLLPHPFAKVIIAKRQAEESARKISGVVESLGFGCTFRRFEPVSVKASLEQIQQAKLRVPAKHEFAVPRNVTVHSRTVDRSSSVVVLQVEFASSDYRGLRDLTEAFPTDSELIVEDSTAALQHEMERSREAELTLWRNRTVFAMAFALPALVISMGPGMMMSMDEGEHDSLHRVLKPLNITVLDLVMLCLTTPVMFVSGYPFHREAFHTLCNLKHKSLGMSFLVSLGATSAYLFSLGVVLRNAQLRGAHKETMMMHDNFETCAVLIAFVILGKFLECLAKSRTSEALTSLVSLRPATAVLVQADGERVIPWYFIQKDDLLRCALGSRIPADGTVVEGSPLVDQAALTGESLPVQKSAGDVVMGGSICSGGGGFTMRVTGAGADSVLSHIIELVENAQTSKAPIERMADEISKRFVPFIVLLSLLTLGVWSALVRFTNANHEKNVPDGVLPFLFALAVLVVACPCALGLATPTAVMVGSGVGASNGVLIKSGAALEAMAKVNCFVFDKTGTLTKGQLDVEQVVRVQWCSIAEDEILQLASAAERTSDHPIAQAIVRRASTLQPVEMPATTHVREMEGRGVRCYVGLREVAVGNLSFFSPSEIMNGISETVHALESKGCTTVVVQIDGDIKAVVGLRDEAKEDSASSVAALQAMGCEVFMITGDNFTAAHVVAAEVGIPASHVMANVLPGDKASAVQALQQQKDKRVVAMVGDGVNDAPALAVANVGVAIGAGTQIAIETADMVLMNSRLADVVTALDLSRVVFRRIKLNFLWALVYNVCGVLMACGLFYPWTHTVLPPWVAAGAMALSSVSVVSSSLLLKRYKKPQLEAVFGKRRGKGHNVSVDAVKVTLNDGKVLERKIDVGCDMLLGGVCSCDASKCTCHLCHHAHYDNQELAKPAGQLVGALV